MLNNCACDLQQATGAVLSLAPLLHQLGITRVWLFGSRVTGQADADSDWDFCVEFTRPISADEYWNLKDAFCRALCSRVDLASPQYAEAWFMGCISDSLTLVFPV
jgi:predicted nucleotidyltransferase